MPNSVYALILAGGSGERFWPLSRRARPKQLLQLVASHTLLEATLRRLDGFIPRENILVLTNVDQEKAVRDLLRDLPAENIVAEPAKRDTAAAVALGVGWVAARDHFATMVVLPADHVIKDVRAFQETLHTAVAAAEESNALLTIGVKPTWACPGFGYIEMGEPIELNNVPNENKVYRVVRFREKPNPELAETFVRSGNFRWNAGMFVWSVPTLLSEFNRHAPELADFIARLRSGSIAEVLRDEFAQLPKISFDYAIMEHADRVLVVEAGFDWDDVGGWQAVAAYLQRDEHRNAANCPLTTHSATGNIVFDTKNSRVALLGVHDLIIVRTGDALLVCNRHDAEKIKKLVANLPTELQ